MQSICKVSLRYSFPLSWAVVGRTIQILASFFPKNSLLSLLLPLLFSPKDSFLFPFLDSPFPFLASPFPFLTSPFPLLISSQIFSTPPLSMVHSPYPLPLKLKVIACILQEWRFIFLSINTIVREGQNLLEYGPDIRIGEQAILLSFLNRGGFLNWWKFPVAGKVPVNFVHSLSLFYINLQPDRQTDRQTGRTVSSSEIKNNWILEQNYTTHKECVLTCSNIKEILYEKWKKNWLFRPVTVL